jgi:hypothetical protein
MKLQIPWMNNEFGNFAVPFRGRNSKVLMQKVPHSTLNEGTFSS